MYIVINKNSEESAIIKDKSVLASHIGKSVDTITRKKDLLSWETREFIIYNPQIILIKSTRGGKR